jgi:6-phosphogluconolactonase (cycloisomerase 2 family)
MFLSRWSRVVSRRRVSLAFAASLLTLALGVFGGAPAIAQPASHPAGAVYVASNAAAGNEVLVFARNARGRLTALDAVPTGGRGTGAGLGSQGAVTLSEDGRYLFVVNAGSDSLSVFWIGERGLRLVDVEPAGGSRPISVTVSGDLVYVLDAGGDGNIFGFRQRRNGTLRPLAGSRQPLSGAGVAPAQISFTPDGGVLVVAQKGTNQLTTYVVDDDGIAGPPAAYPAAGTTPFGFAFDRRGRLIVSEAFGGAALASTVSSYAVDDDGTVTFIDPAVPTLQTAACWTAVSPNGRYAYVTNAGSNSISGFAVARDGSLELLDADGVTGETGMTPIDVAFSRDGQFLYTLNANAHTVSAFRVRADGALAPFAGSAGLPAGAVGLAAQ